MNNDQPPDNAGRKQPLDQNDMYVLSTDDGVPSKQDRFPSLAATSYSTSDGIDIVLAQETESLNGGWIRTMSGAVVNDKRFQWSILGLIVLNSILMGIATFDFVTENPAVARVFDISDTVFLVLFTIELTLQCLYHGLGLFRDGWLTFDFVLITLSWAFSSLVVIRAFRIIRAVRMVPKIKEMKDLVLALMNVIPKLVAIGMLLLLDFYIFAVMFTNLFKSLYDDGYTTFDYFSRLDKSLFTCFQLLTLDSWSVVAKETMAVYGWAWFPLVTFVCISSFIVINLIIAVICDAVNEIHSEQHRKDVEEMNSRANTPVPSAQQQEIYSGEEIRRLEKKIDELTSTVQMLLKSQAEMTESLRLRRETR